MRSPFPLDYNFSYQFLNTNEDQTEMEVSGVVLRQIPCLSGAATDTSSPLLRSVSESFGLRSKKASGIMCAVFQDKGHLSYYYEPTRCGGKKEKEIKERAKLVKSLSKKLSTFSSVGFGVDPQDGLVGEVQSKTISEAADILQKQLEQLKAQEKERKKQKRKAKGIIKTGPVSEESSSSSSGSDDCGGEVSFRNKAKAEAVDGGGEGLKRVVEVCMGGKCSKCGGGAPLLEEFQRVLMGGERAVAVLPSKCMGKCSRAPNVRLFHHSHLNPLCLGVSLQDVEAVVSDYFPECAPS